MLVLLALGETPPYVMAQMGHTTPNLTLAIYARQMDRRNGEPERLKALVQGRTGYESPVTALRENSAGSNVSIVGSNSASRSLRTRP